VGSTLAVVAFLALILLVVIPIHELGHYLVARRFGFKIQEYFIGFGPRLWSFHRGEIEYGVKAIPAGGYVKIAGMNPYEPVAPEDLPRAYGSKPIWQRALVIVAGPLTHLVLGAVLYFGLFATYGDPNTDLVVVGDVAPELSGHPSPASEAGLRVGDVVVRVGDLPNPNGDSLGRYVTRFAREHQGEPLTYVVDRDGRRIELRIVPELVHEGGVTRGRIGFTLGAEPVSIPEAAVISFRSVGATVWHGVATIPRIFGPNGIGRTVSLLVSDEPRQASDPTSLVGVSRQVSDAGSRGDWGTFLAYAGYVTIFIGIVNLIPLPPLDGGHLLLLAWEKITRRQVDYRRLVPVSAAVIVLLSMFVVATVFLDLTKPLPIT
jgi:membrane-associated protease RseP (regulator of RpoE activity)